jgi:tricorn protease
MNVWAYDPDSEKLTQLTHFDDIDVKWLSGHDDTLVFERNGYLHTLDVPSGKVERVQVRVLGDFPWSETRWEDVKSQIQSVSLSATGKRALFEARGEIFTVPVEKGDPRNLTHSPGAADRAPTWSPQGNEVAWFSDSGDGYELLIAQQDGLSKPRRIAIGESKMAWETTWSPDGGRIAFVDDKVRLRIVHVESGEMLTADTGGSNIERGDMDLAWSPDSKWLAYAKTFANNHRRIVVWSLNSTEARPLTDFLADAAAPSWSRDGKHLYFLASTNVALGSGWANTSRMAADPEYGVYAIVLAADQSTPFTPESDEEEPEKPGESGDEEDPDSEQSTSNDADEAQESEEDDEKKDDEAHGEQPDDQGKGEDDEKEDPAKEEETNDDKKSDKEESIEVRIDFDKIERRIVSVPMPVARYESTFAGPKGTLFVSEQVTGGDGLTIHKFSFEDRKATEFLKGTHAATLSADGK